MDLEQVWKIREEDIYPSFFGSTSRGIFPLELALFTGQFGQTKVDPRWLHYGVIEFAPTSSRGSWLYVTSGHSNPWEQEPDAYSEAGESGVGVEFTLAATEQGDWAIERSNQCSRSTSCCVRGGTQAKVHSRRMTEFRFKLR